MIPKECKRLAEVDFPISGVSRHAAKTGRKGQPATLHLWWARRPTPACRAVLLALLLRDPCDSFCPAIFREKARAILRTIQTEIGPTDMELRAALLKFISDFASNDLSSKQKYVEAARLLVKATHDQDRPVVVDTFAGGGSIPLEALRLQCEAIASDLNPVASLILKTLLEDIPRVGAPLADELRRIGSRIAKMAEKELVTYYSDELDHSKAVAYLWARTVHCEAPNCGAEIPLMRSFWLSRKPGRKRALRFNVSSTDVLPPKVQFEIFEPRADGEVPNGTIANARATCLVNRSHVLLPERVRAQLREQRGGADVVFDDQGVRTDGAQLLALVTSHPARHGREYRLPNASDYESVFRAANSMRTCEARKLDDGLTVVPHETISLNEVRRVSVPIYGATEWADIWTSRQKLVLVTYAKAIRSVDASEACRRLAALAFDRLVMQLSAHCRWKPTGESVIDMFGRHAIGMVWDFAEASPGFGASNIFAGWVEQLARFIMHMDKLRLEPGQAFSGDACNHPLPDSSCSVWFTDPPYYDSIPYAHLSDCFYVWLKRLGLARSEQLSFATELTPKDAECVVDRPHRLSESKKDTSFFENSIQVAATEGRRITDESGVGCIVFAHKTTEGWEALLSGIASAGWSITASWPIATELPSRLNARDTASLATSVHLVCRPRVEDTIGDWGEVFRELPKRVGDWMERLQAEGIRGADLIFACIGPALEIYSRYAKVVDAEEREIPLGGNPEAKEPHLRGYLSYVWEVVGRSALEQILGTAEARARNGAAGALEEDARLTALFLWTMQSTNGSEQKANGNETEDDAREDDAASTRATKKGFSLLFDVVRRFAQPLGIRLPEWEGRIIETKKGVVRLLSVSERGRQLFGEEGAEVVADRLETDSRLPLTGWLPGLEPKPTAPSLKARGRKSATRDTVSDESLRTHREATTLDRVHAAMILQSSGRANALRALLKSEQERGPDFVRLANALSALYPKDCEEKRLLDAMLLAVPR